METKPYTGKIGDLRRVCRKCDICGKGCDGCFVGNGGVAEDSELWDNGCSTICRDEDIEVGRLEPLGLFSYIYHKEGWMCDGRTVEEANQRFNKRHQ